MAKTIENKISSILFGISLASLSIFAPIYSHAAQQFDYEKVNLLQSDRVMNELPNSPKSAKWIKYRNNKAVFAVNIGTQREPNHEVFISDSNGSNQQRLTYHPFSDRFPVWVSDKEVAIQRIGTDSGKLVQAYYIINTETGKFKLIKQDEYNSLKEKSAQAK